MGLYSYKIYDENEHPFLVFIRILISAGIVYLGYLSYIHITEIDRIMKNTYSFGGELLNLILIPVALVMLFVSFFVGIALVVALVKLLIIAIKDGPKKIAHEVDIIKRIWDNRGFGKYSIFGGFSFYLKLRQRVLAFLFGFLCVGIVAWYFTFKQQEYEKTYWKVSFYYGEPTPRFIFKPNVPYTMKSGPDIYAITINGNRYVTGKNSYWRQDENNLIPFEFPEKWNITFPETTYVHFNFYSEPINQIFSQSFELWAYKKEGVTIPPSVFMYEWQLEKPKETKTTTKKKKTKKKRR